MENPEALRAKSESMSLEPGAGRWRVHIARDLRFFKPGRAAPSRKAAALKFGGARAFARGTPKSAARYSSERDGVNVQPGRPAPRRCGDRRSLSNRERPTREPWRTVVGFTSDLTPGPLPPTVGPPSGLGRPVVTTGPSPATSPGGIAVPRGSGGVEGGDRSAAKGGAVQMSNQPSCWWIPLEHRAPLGEMKLH